MSDTLLPKGTLAGRIDICWLNSLSEIDARADDWRALDAASTAELVWFQSFAWCRNWIAHHLSRGEEPRVLFVCKDGAAVAVLPLVKRKNWLGIRVLEILGEPHTQYGNVLTRAGHLEADVVAAMRSALRQENGADTLVFGHVPDGAPMADMLSTAAGSVQVNNEAAILDLKGMQAGEDFTASLSKHAQKEMRRRQRLVESEIPNAHFRMLRPGDADYAARVDSCVEMKRHWLFETGRMGSGLMYQNHADFLASLPMEANGDGPILWSFEGDDRPIAVEIGFLQRGHYYCYMASFDWTLRKMAPGKIQKSLTINALVKMGATAFDLMANPTDYKREYSNRTVNLSRHVVNLSLRGQVYTRMWTSTVDPMLRHAFHSLPTGLRQRLAAARRLTVSSAQP